jgi:hypothetical protein
LICEERDAGFWNRIVEHPAVAHVTMGFPCDLSEIVANESVTPLASENGGFIFCRLDGLGRVQELHTLFTPEGWGREVTRAAKEAFARMFASGAALITTYEVRGWAAPPLSFGWRAVGDFSPTPIGDVRTWILTSDAWALSPACRRHKCP